MSQKTLACGVSEELHDEYRALIPDGMAVNAHLRGLVEAFVRNPAVAAVADRYVAPAVEPLVGRWAESSVRTLADPVTCLHPRETLVRDGRFVRCTLCDHIIR